MTARAKRRVVTCVAAILVALPAAWLLLRASAAVLVVDEPADDFQYIVVLDWYNRPNGYRCYDVAAQLQQESPSRRILLVQWRPNRLVEMGVLTSFEELSRRELHKRGVPLSAITVLDSAGCDDWSTAQALQTWLIAHPDASCMILCGQFRSGVLRHALNKVMKPEIASRLRIRGLPDQLFDETNWWMSRNGIRAFGVAWCRRIHGWFASSRYSPPPFRTSDDYERHVGRTLTGAAP